MSRTLGLLAYLAAFLIAGLMGVADCSIVSTLSFSGAFLDVSSRLYRCPSNYERNAETVKSDWSPM